MSNWQKRSTPNIPEFDLPVTRGTPPADPTRTEKLRAYRREFNRRRYDTPTAKTYRRRYYEAHYVLHPRQECDPSPAERAEIEQRIAAMRLLKERGMMLRGKEERDATL